MCNISINFCDIDIQHLQHTETLETYYCNSAFSVASAWTGSLTRSSMLIWSSKSWSGVEVASVEIVDGMDLGRGRGMRMEHGRNGRRKSGSELVST